MFFSPLAHEDAATTCFLCGNCQISTNSLITTVFITWTQTHQLFYPTYLHSRWKFTARACICHNAVAPETEPENVPILSVKKELFFQSNIRFQESWNINECLCLQQHEILRQCGRFYLNLRSFIKISANEGKHFGRCVAVGDRSSKQTDSDCHSFISTRLSLKNVVNELEDQWGTQRPPGDRLQYSSYDPPLLDRRWDKLKLNVPVESFRYNQVVDKHLEEDAAVPLTFWKHRNSGATEGKSSTSLL